MVERLKVNIEKKWYPPRFRLEVVKQEASFFNSRRYLKITLKGGKKNFTREIAIPGCAFAGPTCRPGMLYILN